MADSRKEAFYAIEEFRRRIKEGEPDVRMDVLAEALDALLYHIAHVQRELEQMRRGDAQ